MLKAARRAQCMALLEEMDCDVLLLYGNGWRKDFFRCLIDLDYSGPDALASVNRSGDVFAALTDPWDWELARSERDVRSERSLELETVLREWPSLENQRVAVAGLGLMEARFVKALEQNSSGPPLLCSECKTSRSPQKPKNCVKLCGNGCVTLTT